VMKEQDGGCIINLSSAAGIRPSSVLPVYSISKAAVIMATKVMAQEWGKYGIRVNAVAPGVIKTRFSEALWNDPQISAKILNKVPMQRFAEPEEIVGAMLYLASNASQYVTGTVISVDGGEVI